MVESHEKEKAPVRHEAHAHKNASAHHHHTHAAWSRHEHGHHLLTVEDLSVSFRMYETDDSAAEGSGREPGLEAGTCLDRKSGTRLGNRPRSRLKSYFGAKQRSVEVIRSLSVSVHVGEIVAVVGASGSGKSLLADAIMGLYEPNATVRGRIWFDGQLQNAASLAKLRGSGIALVPQSVASLDPLMKVGKQVRGVPRGKGTQRRADKERRRRRQQELFARYDLAPETASLYPHELSGGMARRVLLCCALMEEPRLIIADEPTPGLDLDLAVRALDDFRAFADEGGGVLLITHDIELALAVADRVAVFRDGTVAEETAVANFASPELLHTAYAKELWHALPEHDFDPFASNDPEDEAGPAANDPEDEAGPAANDPEDEAGPAANDQDDEAGLAPPAEEKGTPLC